jgi:hypothetical protein
LALVLGEFFLCNRDHLDGELLEFGPGNRAPSVGAKGLTPVNIASLGALIGAGSYDANFDQCGKEHYEADRGDSGVWDVPTAVCEALAASGNLETVAERSVATEELRLDGWRLSDGLGVLKPLCELLSHQEEWNAPVFVDS